MATGNITVTSAANFIPEIWSKEAIIAAEKKLVMANLVLRDFEGDIVTGDTVHIPLVSDMSAVAKAADTDCVFENTAEAKVDVSINKHYYAAFKEEDIVKIQANQNLLDRYTKKIGYALAKQIDTDLLALYSGLSQAVGAGGAALDEDVILAAKDYLDEADAPDEDRYLVIYPNQHNALLKIPRFTEADKIGDKGDLSPILKGKLLGEIAGFQVFKSTNVPSATGIRHNLAFHKEAFALAIQMAIRMQSQYVVKGLGVEVVGDVIYGVGEIRDTFAVDVRSAT